MRYLIFNICKIVDRSIRNNQLSLLTSKNGRCGKCPFFKYCGGGCALQGMIFNGDYLGADNSCCVFHRDGWHKKISQTFAGWQDLKPIPDDIDPQYLIDLNIDEVPHIDMKALAASKFEILERSKQGLK